MKLFLGMLWGFIAQTVTFFQLQGTLKYEWLANNKWLAIIMGIPVTWMYMQSVHYLVPAFGGEIWPSRLIGFAIGAIVFTVLSISLFGEPVSTKTAISLTLAVGILLVQLFWK
jgi:ABC-type enterochelin transport system permease subunit